MFMQNAVRGRAAHKAARSKIYFFAAQFDDNGSQSLAVRALWQPSFPDAQRVGNKVQSKLRRKDL